MRPHLSVVVTARNDNHGQNMLYRMQHFVSGFIEQCKRHELDAELIIVEWNPPDEALSLSQALIFPLERDGPCTIRFIQVPKEAHNRLGHSGKIALFQMIGKNVGIRKALGKFILATNIDILFSDPLMRYLKNRLIPGYLYRADRLDVPEKLPQTNSLDEILNFCSKNVFRINGRFGTKIVEKKVFNKSLFKFVKVSGRYVFVVVRKILYTSVMSIIAHDIPIIFSFRKDLIKIIGRVIKRIIYFIHPENSFFLHTNACGDFTLLAAEDWKKLKGYPEWNIFSWHLDSILLYQARQHGIKEVALPKRMAIYHIEHAIGSGYSAEGAKQLFCRLEDNGIPYIKDKDLAYYISEMKKSEEAVVYNNDSWGMAELPLEETLA